MKGSMSSTARFSLISGLYIQQGLRRPWATQSDKSRIVRYLICPEDQRSSFLYVVKQAAEPLVGCKAVVLGLIAIHIIALSLGDR